MAEQAHAVATGTLAPEVSREIARLLAADLLVFTFPLWWYSVPGALKSWFDRVLANGVAYGPGWDPWRRAPLQGKRAVCAITCSTQRDGFEQESGDLLMLLNPVHWGTLGYVGLEVLEPFVAYGADEVDDAARRAYLAAWRRRLPRLEAEQPIALGPLRAAGWSG